jgi:hypothetical protein
MPSDDFNDNRKGSMWRYRAKDDASKMWLSEDTNQLNIGSPGWIDLISSCIGHWRMNDADSNTTVIDSSGNGNNGTAGRNTIALHTTGKIDGALTFNGTSSDYVNLGFTITGAYTKVAWVKRAIDSNSYYDNIVTSDTTSNIFWAPYHQQYKLSAGNNGVYYQVQDSVPLPADGNYHFVAVTYNNTSGAMVLYRDGNTVATATASAPSASATTYIGRYSTGYNFGGAIDNVMIFDRALTGDEIAMLYNQGQGTEDISGGGSPQQASYNANGWSLDTGQDLAVSVDYHYGAVSVIEGWAGITVGDEVNYVSISVGSDGGQKYYYYETVIDGNIVTDEETRTADDGTLYVSYDSNSSTFYISHTGYGAGEADSSAQGLWLEPVTVSLGGGSAGAALASGDACLDNFLVDTAGLLDWPPRTDLDIDGYIDLYDLEMMAANWLRAGYGDFDNNSSVDFIDFAELALAW